MGQALLRSDAFGLGDKNMPDSRESGDQGSLYNFELERRLRTLGITKDEYKKRVTITLTGYKVGVTEPEDIDTLLGHANREIFDVLESTWNMVDGQFDGWKTYDGNTMGTLNNFVIKNI